MEQHNKCRRCGYEWIGYVERPKLCPQCQSRAWDKPRVRPARSSLWMNDTSSGGQ